MFLSYFRTKLRKKIFFSTKILCFIYFLCIGIDLVPQKTLIPKVILLTVRKYPGLQPETASYHLRFISDLQVQVQRCSFSVRSLCDSSWIQVGLCDSKLCWWWKLCPCPPPPGLLHLLPLRLQVREGARVQAAAPASNVSTRLRWLTTCLLTTFLLELFVWPPSFLPQLTLLPRWRPWKICAGAEEHDHVGKKTNVTIKEDLGRRVNYRQTWGCCCFICLTTI